MQNFSDRPVSQNHASLNAWRQDDLISAVAILSQETQGVEHHRLANLSLVRARIKQWDLAERDALASIRVQPTILGHIAVSIALAGQGKLAFAKQEFNQVFLSRELKSTCLLLLIKTIIIFMGGDRDEAVRRMTDLVEACTEADKLLCHAVRAQMQFLIGQTAMGEQDYEKALQSFARAGAPTPFSNLPELETISLMFGWNFHWLLLCIRQQTCEALYATLRISEAAGSLRAMFDEFGTEMKASTELSSWLGSFTRRCVEALEAAADTAMASGKYSEAIAYYSTGLSLGPLSGSLSETIESLRSKIVRAEQQLRTQQAHEQKDRCEALYAEDRIIDAAHCLLEFTNTMNEEVRADGSIVDWVTEFKSKCISTLERDGDKALNNKKEDEAVTAFSTALLLGPPTSDPLLIKWAGTRLIRSSLDDVLTAASRFELATFPIYRAICDTLERDSRISEAIKSFRQMRSELGDDSISHDERAQWEFDFLQRCAKRLGKRGDVAMENRNYDEAVQHFLTVLSLDLAHRMKTLIKQSEAQALMNRWEEALNDADEAIKLDPSSHQGYERRHGALHGAGRYAEAVEAFHTMLSKMDQSPDPHVRELRQHYFDATPTIRRIVTQTTRHMPRVLINTTTGRLHDRPEQAAAFEALPIYSQLVSSMTTDIDYTLIRREVKMFYRYVMLSHKWEHNEPLFQKVKSVPVYDLEPSPENEKLQRFCSLVQSLGFQWAWTDTCCIDKSNNVILQEAIVAMFTWYRGSSLTIVYLRDVSSESQLPGDLQRSIWNTRAWTYGEYVAAETIQFYTEDWKPYLGSSLANHKDSPAVISEMQQVIGVSAEEMGILRPGLDRVRQKLYLVSGRQTTLAEDIAYSLYGVFNVALSVIYGEGNRAVGRLLEYILTGSGNVSILAWTGRAGTYNSCLPIDLTVYNELMPPHIPQPIGKDEMDKVVSDLQSSLSDPSLALELYDQLYELPSPSMAARRLRLPSIVFRLTQLVHTSGPDPETKFNVYHATSFGLGLVEIRTTDNLDEMIDLCLIHPWIRPLLEPKSSDDATALEKTIQAFRLVARLRQPFGALLLELRGLSEHSRVATDSLIMVQVRDDVPLAELLGNIRTIQVL